MKTHMKEARDEKKISQEALAEIVGVTRQTISFLENGRYNPSLRLAGRISVVLDWPIDNLFNFEEEPWRYNEDGRP